MHGEVDNDDVYFREWVHILVAVMPLIVRVQLVALSVSNVSLRCCSKEDITFTVCSAFFSSTLQAREQELTMEENARPKHIQTSREWCELCKRNWDRNCSHVRH